MDERAGLVTIYHQRTTGRASVNLNKPVFQRRAPEDLQRLEPTLGGRSEIYPVPPDLLQELTGAYRSVRQASDADLKA
jgi:hypothetical protein